MTYALKQVARTDTVDDQSFGEQDPNHLIPC